MHPQHSWKVQWAIQPSNESLPGKSIVTCLSMWITSCSSYRWQLNEYVTLSLNVNGGDAEHLGQGGLQEQLQVQSSVWEEGGEVLDYDGIGYYARPAVVPIKEGVWILPQPGAWLHLTAECYWTPGNSTLSRGRKNLLEIQEVQVCFSTMAVFKEQDSRGYQGDYHLLELTYWREGGPLYLSWYWSGDGWQGDRLPTVSSG